MELPSPMTVLLAVLLVVQAVAEFAVMPALQSALQAFPSVLFLLSVHCIFQPESDKSQWTFPAHKCSQRKKRAVMLLKLLTMFSAAQYLTSLISISLISLNNHHNYRNKRFL